MRLGCAYINDEFLETFRIHMSFISTNMCHVHEFLPRDTMRARYMLWSCVCPSQAGIAPKWLNDVRSCSMISALITNFWTIFHWGGRNGGAKYRWGRFESVIFDQYLAISETVQDRDIMSLSHTVSEIARYWLKIIEHSYNGRLVETDMDFIE